VAEGARLESVYTARYPGFESLSLRHSCIAGIVFAMPQGTFIPADTARALREALGEFPDFAGYNYGTKRE
jgi:hypothetical protein